RDPYWSFQRLLLGDGSITETDFSTGGDGRVDVWVGRGPSGDVRVDVWVEFGGVTYTSLRGVFSDVRVEVDHSGYSVDFSSGMPVHICVLGDPSRLCYAVRPEYIRDPSGGDWSAVDIYKYDLSKMGSLHLLVTSKSYPDLDRISSYGGCSDVEAEGGDLWVYISFWRLIRKFFKPLDLANHVVLK
ncbi:MAG: hypothetical protein DRN81_01550, partial [Thermoproteota archaeon]